MEELILEELLKAGLGAGARIVCDSLKRFFGKKVKKQEIVRVLESIEELKGQVEKVMDILKTNQILLFQEDGMVEVAGIHEASGIGIVTALDIKGPAKIKPGTVSKASGIGNITGTKIGGKE